MVKNRKKRVVEPFRKSKTLLMVLILFAGIGLYFTSGGDFSFTVLQNVPDEMVLEAQIKIVVGEGTFAESYIWDRGEPFPAALKEDGMNGTLAISVTIIETNVIVLDIGLRVEGPVPGEYALIETETGIWEYELDSTVLTDGVYIFTLDGTVDTTPLFHTGGELKTVEYDKFNVIWESGRGYPEEIYGIPFEFILIGGVVVVLLMFISKKKIQQGQIIIMPAGYGG